MYTIGQYIKVSGGGKEKLVGTSRKRRFEAKLRVGFLGIKCGRSFSVSRLENVSVAGVVEQEGSSAGA